jgi:hypothetical protein
MTDKLLPRRHGDTENDKYLFLILKIIKIDFFICVSVSLWFIFGSAFAGQQGGQNPASYLELGVGGAQEAMGGAAVGMRDDVANAFWNPAGLSGIRGVQLEDQYTFLSLGQFLDYFGFANQYRDSLFYGLSFIYYSAGEDLEARTGPSLTPDSIFGDTEMTFMATCTFRLDRQWALGFNLKAFTQSLSTFTAVGAGEDLGIQFRSDKYTTFGFVLQDPLSFMSYSNSTSTFFPITVKGGVSHRDDKLNAKINFDLDWSTDLGLEPRLGLEWMPEQVIALRGGCWAGNLTGGASGGSPDFYFTAGIGLLVPMEGSSLEFDYSLIQDRIVPGAISNQVSLKSEFL